MEVNVNLYKYIHSHSQHIYYFFEWPIIYKMSLFDILLVSLLHLAPYSFYSGLNGNSSKWVRNNAAMHSSTNQPKEQLKAHNVKFWAKQWAETKNMYSVIRGIMTSYKEFKNKCFFYYDYVTINRSVFMSFEWFFLYPHKERVHRYRAAMLSCYASPEKTNLYRATSAFHAFTSEKFWEEAGGNVCWCTLGN